MYDSRDEAYNDNGMKTKYEFKELELYINKSKIPRNHRYAHTTKNYYHVNGQFTAKYSTYSHQLILFKNTI